MTKGRLDKDEYDLLTDEEKAWLKREGRPLFRSGGFGPPHAARQTHEAAQCAQQFKSKTS